MQGLTVPPRDTLTAAAVLAQLTGDWLTVDAGCELLDANLNVVADISDALAPGTSNVSWSNPDDGQTPPSAGCSVTLARELTWGVDQIQLYLLLTGSDGMQARYNVGVYCLTTPDKTAGQTDATGAAFSVYSVTGFDRTYLLNREVGDSYTAGAGTAILTAAADAISAAGLVGVDIDQTGIDLTLAADMSWPLVTQDSGPRTTWLTIVNDLLAAANYDPVWCTETGLFRSQAHVDPSARMSEFTLDVDDATRTIIAPERVITKDVWASPNKWIFIQSGFSGTPTEGNGLYIVTNQSDGPTSIDARGLVWPKTYTLDAADQPTLVSLGDKQVAADRRATATMRLKTGCLPIAGTNDVMALVDADADGITKVVGMSWVLPLDGSLMDWVVESVA